MTTRTRTTTTSKETDFLYDDETLDLDALSEDELEALLFEEEPEKPKGLFNLPTLAGLSLILVGVAYIFQQLGLWSAGIDLTVLAQMLPWLAGILIILLGFGVLSWRPGRSRKRQKAEKKLAKSQLRAEKARSSNSRESGRKSGRKLVKSENKKLAGVASGLAEYFGIDPTLVRIGFVIGTIASGGPFLLSYIILAFVMPGENKKALGPSASERITIIRDS
ncbi:MAG: PspC domain-containing protein [Bacteroidetes bacterium]|nr:PspC domain-containing protein [Bacteroidota bacterium]MDA0875255.1 PspC domain-containing protein [Bacteroidota bacterium]